MQLLSVKSDDSYYYYSSYGSYYEKARQKETPQEEATVNGTGEPEVKTVRVGDVDSEEF